MGYILRNKATLTLWACLAGLLLCGLVRAQPPESVPAPARYIVVYKPGMEPVALTNQLARAHGLGIDFIYRYALQGAAVTVPAARLAMLRNDTRIDYVQEDRPYHIAAQILPKGIDRVDGELDPTANIDGVDERVDVDIAILDTGIDLDHPDLNVFQYAYCRQQGPFSATCTEGDSRANDGNGHGTHVSGTAAALDNGIGVVGIAPGARLWAVKVLDDSGSGTTATAIAGIDYVTSKAAQIEVANMSLTGSGSDPAMDQAIANSVAAGVVYVLAAGNDATDVANVTPAGHPDAITVSALADFDGAPGGLGSGGWAYSSCTELVDDSLACFSNYGTGVDMMAPGVDILSTWNNGGTASSHGTSMAAPHVTGAAALYMANNPGATPAQVKSALISSGDPMPCGGTPGGVCTDDPDGIQEPLLMLGCDDTDNDGICDHLDNCPVAANPSQLDDDADTVGNICDNCVNTSNSNQLDIDGDTVGDACDNCPNDPNTNQSNNDGDSEGDVCDLDDDNDGLDDTMEALLGTDPFNPDTDGDGLSDGDEVNVYSTNPNLSDSDSDGLSDGDEINVHSTNPNVSDTDGDGLSDGDEVTIYSTLPTNPDSDGDGFNDGIEVSAGSDPNNPASVPTTPTGDINGDASVDMLDILLGQRILRGVVIPTPDQLSRGDVAPLAGGTPSPDGIFGINDLLVIERKVLNLISF